MLASIGFMAIDCLSLVIIVWANSGSMFSFFSSHWVMTFSGRTASTADQNHSIDHRAKIRQITAAIMLGILLCFLCFVCCDVVIKVVFSSVLLKVRPCVLMLA